MTTRRASGDLLYVYALLESPRRALRNAGDRIEIVRFGPISAAAERRRTRPTLSEPALRRQHRIVVQLHEAAGALLPVRFGALVEYGELQRVIEVRRKTLLRSLRQVRGRAQMTVRVFGTGVARANQKARLTASGAAYLQAKAALARPAPSAAASAVTRAVRTLVSAERLEPGRGLVQVTLHHLVPQGRVEEYRRRVNQVIASQPEVTVSGPWPPFAFVPDLLE